MCCYCCCFVRLFETQQIFSLESIDWLTNCTVRNRKTIHSIWYEIDWKSIVGYVCVCVCVWWNAKKQNRTFLFFLTIWNSSPTFMFKQYIHTQIAHSYKPLSYDLHRKFTVTKMPGKMEFLQTENKHDFTSFTHLYIWHKFIMTIRKIL